MEKSVEVAARPAPRFVAGLLAVVGLSGALLSPALLGAARAEIDSSALRVAHLPLAFEINAGQFDPRVRFAARALGHQVFVADDEIVLRWPGHSSADRSQALRLRFVGGGAARVTARDLLPGRSNYLVGADPSRWTRDVEQYARVGIESVYPGIDVVFYGNQRQLEYDFVIAPGADPAQVRMRFDGAGGRQIDEDGNLHVRTPSDGVVLRKPVAYQERDGQRVTVDARYVLHEGDEVGIEVAAYDARATLVVDPLVLVYSTYLGGDSLGGTGFPDEVVNDIALDAAGNLYLIGFTASATFPLQNPLFGDDDDLDAFVSKLNAAGDTLLYSTYFGGSGVDIGFAIALDAARNMYVTGQTSSADLPATAGAFDEDCGTDAMCDGDRDGFVAKINAAGNTLVWLTYLGGEGFDKGVGIALDSSNQPYVTGLADSEMFPTTPGSFQDDDADTGGLASDDDAFITKFNAAGTALIYSTYVGGSDNDQAVDIALDAARNAYIVGTTFSDDFPTSAGSFQPTVPAGIQQDGFLFKLNAAGTARDYATYLGGTNADLANAVDLDGAGNAYVVGQTESADFPPLAPAGFVAPFQATHMGGRDAFVTKIAPDGSGIYSTFLGGTLFDEGFDVGVDAAGRACVVGSTASANFPVEKPLQPAIAPGFNRDAFVAKLDPNGVALFFSTFFGGTGDELATSVVCASAARVYFAGSTESTTDLPLRNPAQAAFGGGDSDGFAALLQFDALADAPALSPLGLIAGVLACLALGLWSLRRLRVARPRG